MAHNKYGHDFGNPLSHLNALEVAWLAADSTVKLCQHCKPEVGNMLPMGGTGWGLDLTHEPGCPVVEESL